MEERMSRLPKWTSLLPAACLALWAASSPAVAERGPSLERNETRTQINQHYHEKLAACEAFWGPERVRCRAEAKAERAGERGQANAGHAEVVAKREARDAIPGADKRASLHQAGEEELEVQKRLALARCEEAPLDKRDSCRDVVNARYGK